MAVSNFPVFVNGWSGSNEEEPDAGIDHNVNNNQSIETKFFNSSRNSSDVLPTLDPDPIVDEHDSRSNKTVMVFPPISANKSQTKPETMWDYSEEQRKKDSKDNYQKLSVCKFESEQPILNKDITSIKFFLKINDVHSLKTQCSDEIIVRGIRWKIAVSKDRVNSIDHIGVYLMTQANDLAVDVARDFTVTVKLIAPRKRSAITKNYSNTLCWNCIKDLVKHDAVRVGELIKFGSDLSDFTEHDMALLEVELNVGAAKGAY